MKNGSSHGHTTDKRPAQPPLRLGSFVVGLLVMAIYDRIPVQQVYKYQQQRTVLEEKEDYCTDMKDFIANASSTIQNASSTIQKLAQQAAKAPAKPVAPAKTKPSVDECRDVFGPQGSGGKGTLPLETVLEACNKTGLFNACEDLVAFTGLTESQVHTRMMRPGRFHFTGEHLFWNPQSSTELAWYYAGSIDYLFANVVHPYQSKLRLLVENREQFAPVLDYSGGVGNNILYLALNGVDCIYFGIGMAEAAFARYRVQKRNLTQVAQFWTPHDRTQKFDPVNRLPQDETIGSIIAQDVLEHIPHYERTVAAMVASLKPGGVIIENSPFAKDTKNPDEDQRVHLSSGGITMEEAMGPRMKFDETKKYWVKQK